MWVADMDFESPACIKSALRKYVDNGIFGYHSEPKGLREILKKYLSDKGCDYYFLFEDDMIVLDPSVFKKSFKKLIEHLFISPSFIESNFKFLADI